MFAVIAPALMTGAFADRMLFRPYLIYIFCWVHLVYFPFCHWVWGRGQSDKISHIDLQDDRIDTIISHIISPHPISISRMTISIW
jgi:ammonia channel protein AmtB